MPNYASDNETSLIFLPTWYKSSLLDIWWYENGDDKIVDIDALCLANVF